MTARHQRLSPLRSTIRTGSLLAASAATGLGVILAGGASQAVTVSPATQAASSHAATFRHWQHVAHLAHLARRHTVTLTAYRGNAGSGYSFTGLEQLWISAGGPAWAAPRAASVAICESGGQVHARNPSSSAAGLWQILGAVRPGDLNDPYVNAANAVAKFQASGDTFAQWVCR